MECSRKRSRESIRVLLCFHDYASHLLGKPYRLLSSLQNFLTSREAWLKMTRLPSILLLRINIKLLDTVPCNFASVSCTSDRNHCTYNCTGYRRIKMVVMFVQWTFLLMGMNRSTLVQSILRVLWFNIQDVRKIWTSKVYICTYNCINHYLTLLLENCI